MAVSRWERGAQEPTARSYIELGNLAREPQCWYFWARAGLRHEDLMQVVPQLRRRLYALDGASEVDKAFVGKVSQGGMYEVEASKVAVQKAVEPDVRDLAIAEVHDHEGVNRKLKKISADKGVPVSGALNSTFQQRLEKLKSASGNGFDAAYISDIQEIHDNDEKLFAQEAVDGSDSFKSFAHETDLIVKRHIDALHGLDVK
jgi:putative membrane protein